MKRILKIAAFAFVMVLGSSLRNTASAQYDQYDQYNNDNEVSYQTFYDELSPYGQWIDYPEYGYVWVPDASPDFRPYSTNGHWVWTDDYEWMWVSDYDWGWAPFHYGRWEEDAYYGWIWIPGYEWSPAWVAWRDGGDYYGWAPLRPGITISINFNIGSYNPPYDYWCFVPRRYITSPRIYDFCVDRRTNINIINYTTIINYNNYRSGYGFRSGPRRYDVERYAGRINPVRLRNSNTPGRTFFRNNEVSVYRPQIRRDAGRSIAPRQYERYDRNSGSFRDRSNNNGSVRRNDNTTGRNDNVFNRNGNNGGFDRRDRTTSTDQPFRRNDNTVRQPQTDGNNDRRVFERPTNDRNDRRFDSRGNNNGNNDDQFRRRNNQNVGGQPDRQPSVEPRPVEQPRQFERRNEQVQPRQEQPRQFERRNEQVQPRQEQPRQFERRNEQVIQPRQEQPRQFERRNEQVQPRQEQPRQFERRNEQVVQPRQEQPRQFERRNEQVVQPRQEQPRSVEKRGDDNDGNKGEGRGRGRGRN